MIRATTGGVMKTYRRNLMNSFISQSNAINTVLTQRVFNSYAEDPASAAKAFRLRKSRMTVSAQYDVCCDTLKKYETGFKALQSIGGLLDTKNGSEQMNTLKQTTLRMLNDPNGDARTQLAKALDQLGETIIQNLNQKYGDNFIFAGADGQNVPFEIKSEGGVNKLYYRGVPVDASVPELMEDANGDPIQKADGSYVLANASTIKKLEFEDDGAGGLLSVTLESGATSNVLKGASSVDQTTYDGMTIDQQVEYTKVELDDGSTAYYKTSDLASEASYTASLNNALKDANGDLYSVEVDGEEYYIVDTESNFISEADYNAAKSDADKLKYLAGENLYVDIGLGFQENLNGQLISSSAFDAALNGLTFIGYGLDADGDPKNIYSLVQRMKEIAENVPEGEEWTTAQYEEFYGLVQKLEDASSEFKTQFTNMAANTTRLENNEQLLKENFYNLKEQYSELEDVDMVEAINSFLWAQYSYNAALRVGNSVLSQSLMDYLN